MNHLKTKDNMENDKQQPQVPTAPRPPQEKLPYEAPAVEVIEVQTERGYAGSILPMPGHGW